MSKTRKQAENICSGVSKRLIINGRLDHSVLLEILTDEGVGALISSDLSIWKN